MKKQIVQVVCICLALVFTINSLGIAATKQTCLMACFSKALVEPEANKGCSKKETVKPVPAKTKVCQKCYIIAKQY